MENKIKIAVKMETKQVLNKPKEVKKNKEKAGE
jgi:hypothetical protein